MYVILCVLYHCVLCIYICVRVLYCVLCMCRTIVFWHVLLCVLTRCLPHCNDCLYVFMYMYFFVLSHRCIFVSFSLWIHIYVKGRKKYQNCKEILRLPRLLCFTRMRFRNHWHELEILKPVRTSRKWGCFSK